jgi:hypothetical protein
MALNLTENQVSAYVGKNIGDICENKFNDTNQNHCAHFVSHVLGIKLAVLCGDLNFSTRHTGATIRCNELYNNLPSRGLWTSKPTIPGPLLIFITSASAVKENIMQAVPQKHVGIYFSGPVYNYSNAHAKVAKDLTVQAFFDRINAVYSADDIALFYGVPV